MKLFVGLLLLLAFSLTSASSSALDNAYEFRAQEVIGTLSRYNGLLGWNSGEPAAWPVASGQNANGAGWDWQVEPLGLAELNLAGAGLSRGVDFSGLVHLKSLNLSGNHLQSVNLTGNRSLLYFSAADNSLAALDLNSQPLLKYLAVGGNAISRLDLSGQTQLETLLLAKNKLTSLDLSALTELEVLEAGANELAEINLRAAPKLSRLSLSSNKLESLYLASNLLLQYLNAEANKLANLSLATNGYLTELAVGDNSLAELVLSSQVHLASLTAEKNELSILDLSANKKLTHLELQKNPLEQIILGDNALPELEVLNLENCRLPLSQLAGFSGRAQNRARLGHQSEVLFKEIELAWGQRLNLAQEAFLNGEETEFVLLTERERFVKPRDYSVEKGVISFKKPGTYIVEMTNPAIYSSTKNPTTGSTRRLKIKVTSGLVVVLPPELE